jgi:hypothetical protein
MAAVKSEAVQLLRQKKIFKRYGRVLDDRPIQNNKKIIAQLQRTLKSNMATARLEVVIFQLVIQGAGTEHCLVAAQCQGRSSQIAGSTFSMSYHWDAPLVHFISVDKQ